MKTLILRRLAFGLLPALLAWPTTALWAGENTAVVATTPNKDFKFYPQDTDYPNDGTAYHKKTGLTWKRCPEGWDWNVSTSTCENNSSLADAYTWSQALQRGPANDGFAGFNDWRLPNLKELQSIVEQRNWDPAINSTVFPNTPIAWWPRHFWSASNAWISASNAWIVVFYDGYDGSNDKGNNNTVRLVRGGQYSLLSVTKAGTGSGTVTSNPPGSIDCGPFCKGSFANKMFATAGEIILTATADANSVFDGWEGCTPLAEGNKCTFALSTAADTSVTANFSPEITVITVAIDIKPGSFPNSINPRSKGVIPVAILTTNGFDATKVDPLSVRFGIGSATESHGRGHIEDANGDGRMDLVLHFATQNSGIQCGDTSASLTGNTFTGQAIVGSDSINTVGCK